MVSRFFRRSLLSSRHCRIFFGGTKTLFKREVLFKAGLYDESLSELILGEDLDLALRIYKCGFTGMLSRSCKVYHLEIYHFKHRKMRPKDFENYRFTEAYIITKHRDMLGIYVVFHVIYVIIWSFLWALRKMNPKVFLYCMRGLTAGIFRGLRAQWTCTKD